MLHFIVNHYMLFPYRPPVGVNTGDIRTKLSSFCLLGWAFFCRGIVLFLKPNIKAIIMVVKCGSIWPYREGFAHQGSFGQRAASTQAWQGQWSGDGYEAMKMSASPVPIGRQAVK